MVWNLPRKENNINFYTEEEEGIQFQCNISEKTIDMGTSHIVKVEGATESTRAYKCWSGSKYKEISLGLYFSVKNVQREMGDDIKI